MTAADPDESPLADELTAAAEALEAATVRVAAVHREYVRQVEDNRTWRELATDLTAEVRTAQMEVELYSAIRLAEHVRREADDARRRFPLVGRGGEVLPPRPPSREPAEVARWWADLEPEQQAALIERRPALVGRTDGLPVRVRHEANLRVLAAERQRLTALLASDTPDAAGADQADHAEDLAGLDRLHELLTDDDTPPRPGHRRAATPASERFLYLLDVREHPVRAAVLLGDPERADHVVVHVPGATTRVGQRLFREFTWMSDLRAETARFTGDQGTVAVLDWIGYPAPRRLTDRRPVGTSGLSVPIPGEASDERFAREAAPLLVRCLQGLRTVMPEHARLVASGHSYGGSVVGLALQPGATLPAAEVDAAVVAGCPGLFADTLDQLHIEPKALYIAISPTDVIGMLGVFGTECLHIPGIQLLSPYARAVSSPDGRRSLLLPSLGHEAYYNPGTATLYGIAAVCAGHLDHARTTTWLGMTKAPAAVASATDAAVASATDAVVTGATDAVVASASAAADAQAAVSDPTTPAAAEVAADVAPRLHRPGELSQDSEHPGH